MKEGFWKKIGMLAGCVAFSAFAASAPEGNLAVVGVEKVFALQTAGGGVSGDHAADAVRFGELPGRECGSRDADRSHADRG